MTMSPVRPSASVGRLCLQHKAIAGRSRIQPPSVAGPAANSSGADRSWQRWFPAWVRLLVGPVIIGVLVWRVGTGPFIDGIGMVDGWSLAAATGIAFVTTVCSAWRWRLVADGLGVRVALLPAIAAYYRSQFLNVTLPCGVLGDVHRGVSHGRDSGNLGGGLRAVGWERAAGQVVQVGLAVVLLAALPSPVPSWTLIVAGAALVTVVSAGVLVAVVPPSGPSGPARLLRATAADIRSGLLARRTWPGVLLASLIVVVGHTATFLIAARTAGSSAPLRQLLPLAVVVLLAAAIPTNIGGWGPREGIAAWAFAAAGFGAEQGVAAAVVFGVMVAVSTLPGVFVLLVGRVHRGRTSSPRRAGVRWPGRIVRRPEVHADG